MVYPMKCRTCGNAFDKYTPFSEIARVRCHVCGGECEQDYARKQIGANLAVTRAAPQSGLSMRYGFHPDEVNEARKELPSWSITDDGDVVVDSTTHNSRMMNDLESMQVREAIKNSDSGLDPEPKTVTVPKQAREARKRDRVERIRALQARKTNGRKAR